MDIPKDVEFVKADEIYSRLGQLEELISRHVDIYGPFVKKRDLEVLRLALALTQSIQNQLYIASHYGGNALRRE